MTPSVYFLFASALVAQTRLAPFPPIGGARSQQLSIHLVALGDSDSTCGASVAFRFAATGTLVASAERLFLRMGEATTVTLRLDSLGLGDLERTELQPVVELDDPGCFASVELSAGPGRDVAAYVSGSMLSPGRPSGATESPYIEASATDSVVLVVNRLQQTDVGLCDVHLGFRDASGAEIGPQQGVTLAPGAFQSLTLKVSDLPSPQLAATRILLDVRPVQEGSGAGCAAAVEVYDATGATVRYATLAVPRSTTALSIPPPPQTATDPPPLPPIGGPSPIGQPVTIRSPLGLPPLAIPPDNPPTAEMIALGRRLFFDKRLSVDGTVACASCHDPAAGFSDPRRLSLGVNGSDGERHSMSVVNSALSQEVFWDGRSNGLEAQAREPVRGALEFAHSLESAEQRLQADPSYVKQFEEAFGLGTIVYDMAAKAIASFERTLLSGNSPFDRYFFRGDRNAINVSAQRGFELFRGIAGCSVCHQVEGSFATFGSTRFFNTGVAATSFTTLKDQGRWKVTQRESDRGAFRPPSLRNVALRAPYMHDGSLRTLAEVVQFYRRGGVRNQWLSPEMPGPAPANSNFQDFLDIEEFLKSLTGEMPANAGPPEEK